MNKAMTCRSGKSGFADPVYYYVLAAAGIVFLYMAYPAISHFFYEYYLIIPCLLCVGSLLERRIDIDIKNRKYLILSLAMMAWFLVLQIRRAFEQSELNNIGLFIASYLFAFPLASLLRDGDRKRALKIFGGAYLAAAAVLAAEGLLLVFDCIPVFLAKHIFWDGARLQVFWHPNLVACFWMIGIVFCTTFCTQARLHWLKLGLWMLIALMLMVQSLTNSRTAIILTGGYLGIVVFFKMVPRGRRWLLPGILAAMLLTVAYFEGAGWLYQTNQELLIKSYGQQMAIESSNGTINEEETSIKVDTDTGEISLKTVSPQGTIEGDLGTLNGRTSIWAAAIFAIRESPDLLIWGIDRPGWYVSFYNSFKVSHLHNAWMQTLVGMGLVGFLIAVLFTVFAAWNCLVILVKYHQDLWKRNTALLVLLLMAASVLEPYLFYTTVDYHLVDFLFFLYAGYLAHWQEEDNRKLLAGICGRISFLKK